MFTSNGLACLDGVRKCRMYRCSMKSASVRLISTIGSGRDRLIRRGVIGMQLCAAVAAARDLDRQAGALALAAAQPLDGRFGGRLPAKNRESGRTPGALPA